MLIRKVCVVMPALLCSTADEAVHSEHKSSKFTTECWVKECHGSMSSGCLLDDLTRSHTPFVNVSDFDSVNCLVQVQVFYCQIMHRTTQGQTGH